MRQYKICVEVWEPERASAVRELSHCMQIKTFSEFSQCLDKRCAEASEFVLTNTVHTKPAWLSDRLLAIQTRGFALD